MPEIHFVESTTVKKMQCVCVAGPEGTPYHGGCFMFDIFFPQDYPNVPPLMNMATNGEGRARFNPNLYADGKVSMLLTAILLLVEP